MSSSTATTPHATELKLLERFEVLRGGRAVVLPESAQRLIAFLVVRGRPQRRHTVAGMLWMDTSEDQAAANLRTALWRVNRVADGLIESTNGYLAISGSVDVDLPAMVSSTRAIIEDPDADLIVLDASARYLGDDLLPEWYDDWVLIERERLRQLRLHGLEALCTTLSRLGRHLAAIEAGLLAVEADPLRESAQRVLIAAHLAEGNVSEAVRQYDRYALQLDEAMAASPTAALRGLVASWR